MEWGNYNMSQAPIHIAADARSPYTEYTPDSPIRNPLQLVRAIVNDLAQSRGLAWRLLVRDINAQYRQTALGFAWAFIPPLVTTAIWAFLHSQNIIAIDTPNVPYPVFVLAGTVLWQLFSESIQAPLRSAGAAKGMLTRIKFPREALLLAAIGETLVGLAIRLILLLAVLLLFRFPIGPSLLLVPLGILSILVIGTAIGLILVPMGLLYNDINRGISMLLGVWIYLTPVVYPPTNNGWAAVLNWINPASAALAVTRDWMLQGSTDLLPQFFVVSGGACVMLWFALAAYRVAMPIVIERMGA